MIGRKRLKLPSKPRNERRTGGATVVSGSSDAESVLGLCDSRTKNATTSTAASAGIEANRKILVKSPAGERVAISRKQQHQHVTNQRADNCAGVIHRAMKTKRQPTFLDRDRVRNHRVAWRGAYAFAHAIRQTNPQHLMPAGSEGQQWPAQAGQHISKNNKDFSFAEPIAEMPGKKFE